MRSSCQGPDNVQAQSWPAIPNNSHTGEFCYSWVMCCAQELPASPSGFSHITPYGTLLLVRLSVRQSHIALVHSAFSKGNGDALCSRSGFAQQQYARGYFI